MTQQKIRDIVSEFSLRLDELSDDHALKGSILCDLQTELTNLDNWISVEDELPKKVGRYWCYIKEQTDLGISYYQWNCCYNPNDKKWSSKELRGTVTHYQPLSQPPKQSTKKRGGCNPG